MHAACRTGVMDDNGYFQKEKKRRRIRNTRRNPGPRRRPITFPFYKILLWCFLTAIVSGAILYFFVFLNSYFSFSLKETSILDEAVNSIQESEESRNTILNVQVDFYERNLMFAAYQTELLEKDHLEMEPQAIYEEMVRHFSPYEIAVTDFSGNILAHTPEFDMDQYKGISEVPDEGVTIVEEDRSFEFVPCRVTAVRRLNASALVLLQYDENLDGGLVALKNSFSLSQLVAAKSSDEEFVYVVNSDDVIIACGMPDLIGKRQS